ncbi:DnaA N-terminal domain-containing protein, partial [Hansschlegelia beijingensis]
MPSSQLAAHSRNLAAHELDDGSEHDALWSAVSRRLRAEYGEDVYTSWFVRLVLDRIDGEVAYLTVPTRFLKSWIQSHYSERIAAVFAEENSEVRRVSIGVRVAAPKLVTAGRDVVVAPVPELAEIRPAVALPQPPRPEKIICMGFNYPQTRRVAGIGRSG